MPLEKYKEKRSFNKTPEPIGGKASSNKLQFVVQKHAASHLHYDFRLEVRGVLKSWAVPKGPSLNPADKRLAMLVEDHPFDYKDFEGIIPKGNYGAGTVIVWDEGTYEPLEHAATKKEQEKIMLKEFYSGSIKIKMNGKKLKGEFALVKTEGRGDNAWLLIKHRDKYAKETDITEKDKSVASGKTIEQMASDKNADEWISNRKTDTSKTKKRTTASSEDNTATTDITELIKQGKKQAIPKSVSPMLCTLTKEPIDDADFLCEIKWDGYRIISYVQKGKVRMDSRSALDYTKKYPPLVAALKELQHDVVLDGEVVIFNEEGLPDFDALQKYNGHDTPITYCVFDILWLDGYNIMNLPLTQRKQILQTLTEGNETIKYSQSFDNGPALYEEMLKRELEGIVAKKKDSTYNEGERANNWLKTPTRKRQEFVIGGWAESEKSRAFRSLLFGAYRGKDFEWIGRSGGGYKEKEMPDILKRLKALEVDKSPFVNKVLDTKGATIHWVKPELVANFEFATWTKSGRIRKPATFLGFRKDKKAKDVVREIPEPIKEVEEELEQEETNKEATTSKQNAEKELHTAAGSDWPKLEKIKITSEQEFNIGDCTITIHNVERHVWKDIPKAKLIEYYHSIAPYILPHLKDRPLSLHVKPYGATAKGLYIKDMEGRQPDCATIFTDKRRHEKEGKRNIIDYLICNNEATLLYMIDVGCIDINPWMSKMETPDKPDFINIDLDPSDEDFKKVIEVAQAAKEVLEEYKLKSFIKTSGKTGLHIYIPVTGIDNAQARIYSKKLGELIHKKVPKISTLAISTNQRGDKVFIDPSQNDYADTLAAVYSARPFHIPTVSTPLEWKEVNEKLNPSDVTIDTIAERIKKKGDLFKEVSSEKLSKQNLRILTAFDI
jgi:bifunctional non-homologous end joining protein LigD